MASSDTKPRLPLLQTCERRLRNVLEFEDLRNLVIPLGPLGGSLPGGGVRGLWRSTIALPEVAGYACGGHLLQLDHTTGPPLMMTSGCSTSPAVCVFISFIAMSSPCIILRQPSVRQRPGTGRPADSRPVATRTRRPLVGQSFPSGGLRARSEGPWLIRGRGR